MKPRIGYFSRSDNTVRFKFIYPEVKGYESWAWTDFDAKLINKLHASSNITYACHINDSKKYNGLSFDKALKTIFGDLGETELQIEQDIPIDNWWCRTINKLFSMENENRFYCGEITDSNKEHFLKCRDLGCFWYIIFLEEGDEKGIFRSLHKYGINNDTMIHNKEVKFIIYRDYVQNSVSIVANACNREVIHKYISKSGVFIQEKNISNILDMSYLDDLPSNKVSL
ncbi:hypothetical protein MNBD_GAMMA16-320 [hydrothermal vent metagenome]|uniref:Uncharacterized protein n=1 Tax=hydrothermal vent metagenome TaxID=652676 RepID=A0A3B0YRJ3_9ZZZZ